MSGADSPSFDVAVIGAGINGAAIAHALAAAGYRVLLVEQGDIGSGTSQASTMLIWGGLLYLRHLEIATVVALSRDRDRLIRERPDLVQPCPVLYAPSRRDQRLRLGGALAAYWALSGTRRRLPQRLEQFPEQALFRREDAVAYAFEEGALVASDARFVLSWTRDAERHGAEVLNYARVDAVTPRRGGGWTLGVCDALSGATAEIAARVVVNAAGTWVDALNATARVVTPYRHAFSRGVSIALPRHEAHRRHLVVDSRLGDALTLAPWGPVSLWASTDTLHDDAAEARRLTAADVAALLDEHNRHFRPVRSTADIVSVRVGVRALPVAREATVLGDAPSLTRHHRVHLDEARQWISVYGGKLSGAVGLAGEVHALVARCLPLSASMQDRPTAAASARSAPEHTTFPGLDVPVVTPRWSATHEHCWTLDDYLRRRTNIAQWVANGGFGAHLEHAARIEAIALDLHDGDAGLAERDLGAYWRTVRDTRAAFADDTPGPPITPAPPGIIAPAAPTRRRRSFTARWRHVS